MKDTKYKHLVHKIPNNLVTRWLIKRTNKWMRKCNSEYILTARYRKPKTGFAYDRFGTIVPKHMATDESIINFPKGTIPAFKRGKHISLYLRHRDGRTI